MLPIITLRRLVLCLCLTAACAAQLIPSQLAKPATPNSNPQDTLGRETPNGTIFGFLQAAQAGNYTLAAQYLQLSAFKRQTDGEELSRKLKEVMDRAFVGNLRRISTAPEGTPQEGIPLDQQLIGTLSSGGVEADLRVVRVNDAAAGKIWLISSATLAAIPEVYDQLAVRQVESRLPAWLQKQVAGISEWQWLAILLAIPFAMLAGRIAVAIVGIPRFFRKDTLSKSWQVFVRPLWLVLSTVAHRVFTAYLRLPLLARHYYFMLANALLIIGFTWLVWRILRQMTRQFRERAILSGRRGTGSVMVLGERILKAVIFVIAVFIVLGTLGVNMTTVLAGLGIGGIAVAFAAQKTLENLFGGISVLGDEVIHVGDVCRFGDRTGVVEDISLRSTRIRTPERTELSIPNGALATMNVENLSRRDKLLFQTQLGLRSETSPDQLRYVLSQIRKLLYEHPKVETDGARVRLVSLDPSALTLELYCYILTRDNAEYLAVREDLLLRIMDIVAASGTGLAYPTQTLYLAKDGGLDNEKGEAATRQVEQWREGGNLPFPDFAPKEISEISNSLPYPQPESAVRSRK